MARNISNLYDFYLYILRKERGSFVNPNQFSSNLNAGQLDAFQEYFLPYGGTQILHDGLKPFRVYHQFTSNAAGFVVYPDECEHILGAAFTVTGSTVNEITFVNDNEWVFAINSQLRPVSLSKPIALDTNVGFSLYPQSLQIGFFNYLKLPAVPVYAYTQVGRQITYDPVNSVQLEWADSYVNNVLAKALVYAGVNMNEKDIIAYAENYNQQTKP